MPLDPNIYRNIDTNFGLKLADLVNPASIAQRRAAADEQAMGNQLRQMQVMQGVEQMRRAPVLAKREEQQYQAQQAEAQRVQQERMQKQALLEQLKTAPPEQQKQLFSQLFPEKAAEQAFKPQTARDFNQPFLPDGSPNIAYQQYKLAEQRAGKSAGADVNWQTVQTDQGLVQVHPKTGAIRPLGISKPLPAAKQLTEGQAKATTYASQMQSASNVIDKVEGSGFNPTGLGEQLQVGLAGGVTNIFSPAKAQQYKQAQEQWAESFLRAKTGAAATKEEVELNRKTFFPQQGDSKEVVRQKSEARAQAERDVLNMAGAGRELATPRSPAATTEAVSYDAGKEARYQAWKAQQGR